MNPPATVTRDQPVLPARQGGNWWRDLLVLALLAGVWFGWPLGIRPLGNPDEGRYTEIPREMAVSGDFVTPRLNGVKYFEKPPLLYWLSAATFRLAGVNEVTARWWNAWFGVAGVLATYVVARVLYGRLAGWCAAIVLATSVMYFGLSQIVLLDMAASVAMACAMFAFLLGMREPPGHARRCWLLAFYAAMAVATLTKGLIGFVLPGAVLFWWTVLLNRWRTLRPFYPVSGIVLFLVIAAPWHILAAQANKGFLEFYFIHEHFLRFTTKVHERTGPWWYFLPVLALGWLPWAGFLGQAVRRGFGSGWRARHAHTAEWFLFTWIILIVLFFSVSQSKLVPYVLPVWPPIAVLIGRLVADAWQERAMRGMRTGAIVFLAFALCVAIGVWWLPIPRHDPGAAARMLPWRWLLAATFLGGGAVVVWMLRRGQVREVLVAIAASAAVSLAAFNSVLAIYDKRSTKELASRLKPILKPGDRVYSVACYPQDLPVYLGRLIDVVNYRGELSYGIDAEPSKTASRFLPYESFAAQWPQSETAFMVIQRDYYEAHFAKAGPPHRVVAQTSEFLLLTNQLSSPPP